MCVCVCVVCLCICVRLFVAVAVVPFFSLSTLACTHTIRRKQFLRQVRIMTRVKHMHILPINTIFLDESPSTVGTYIEVSSHACVSLPL